MRMFGRTVSIEVLLRCAKQPWDIADFESIEIRVIGLAIT